MQMQMFAERVQTEVVVPLRLACARLFGKRLIMDQIKSLHSLCFTWKDFRFWADFRCLLAEQRTLQKTKEKYEMMRGKCGKKA